LLHQLHLSGLKGTDWNSWRVWLCCLALQFWSIGAIVWFIAAVELTIIWNHIQGVHTISTTSQLIPFVIGITSSVLAVQQIILSWIKHVRILGFFASADCNSLTLEKKYKDWNEIDFKITLGAFGEHSMQIIKHKKVPTSFNKASQTEISAATDRTSISTNGAPRESIDHIGPASPSA
jgi:hypothetical protein